ARALLPLNNEKEQRRFVDRILKEGTSVREIERQARKKISRETTLSPRWKKISRRRSRLK
ncbi:MAG: hypothetical protein QUS12_02390, partial [Methanosarcina sp.]|nr:hypothetical protein [Methanosarcina sp.]